MITYKTQPDGSIHVYVGGKRTGTIIRYRGGWQYRPIGSSLRGDVFPKLEDCKRSLEEEDS